MSLRPIQRLENAYRNYIWIVFEMNDLYVRYIESRDDDITTDLWYYYMDFTRLDVKIFKGNSLAIITVFTLIFLYKIFICYRLDVITNQRDVSKESLGKKIRLNNVDLRSRWIVSMALTEEYIEYIFGYRLQSVPTERLEIRDLAMSVRES